MLEDKITEYLKNYRERKTTLTSREIAQLILRDVKNVLPKMNEAEKNANSHFTIDYGDMTTSNQHEHEGLMSGWQDCIEQIEKALEINA